MKTQYYLHLMLFMTASAPSFCYELGTHARMSEQAWRNSNIPQRTQDGTNVSSSCVDGPQYMQCQLGLDPTILNLLGKYYYDVNGGSITERTKSDFDAKVGYFLPPLLTLNNVDNRNEFSPLGWLERGAIREDDLPGAPSVSANDSPNAWDVRVLNHFYDPVHDIPLQNATLGYLTARFGMYTLLTRSNPLRYIPNKAIDWALGYKDSFANPPAEDKGRYNHYSMLDAREAEWRALTLTSINSGQLTPLSPSTTNVTTLPALRKAYWATAFRSLGDVLHLLQDMAQPQHTRNDMHMGTYFGPKLGMGHKSIYELYAEAGATKGTIYKALAAPPDPSKDFDGTPNDQLPPAPGLVHSTPATPLNYTPIEIPSFPNYLSYFTARQAGDTTANNNSGILSRRGLADYSNRNFYSAGRNAGDGFLYYPNYRLTGYLPGVITQDWCGDPLPAGTSEGLITSTVNDSFAPVNSAANMPIASFGLFDQWLLQMQQQPTFSLNRINYDVMANLLIPRAVGYSTGLLNYFFRGSLAISASQPSGVYALIDESAAFATDNPAFNKLSVTVKNTTADILDNGVTYKQNMSSGYVVAVVRYHKNLCFLPNLTGEYGSGSAGVSMLSCRKAGEVNQFDSDNSYEDIVISKPISIDAGTAINSGSSANYIFDFSDNPIPLGSSDMYLQVVYRGTLGDSNISEPDAIVVGQQLISDPSYYALFNATDYFLAGGSFFKVGSPTDELTGGFKLQINGQDAFTINSFPAASYIRLAMLVDIPTDSYAPGAGPIQINAIPLANPDPNGVVEAACSFRNGRSWSANIAVVNKFPTQSYPSTKTLPFRGVQNYSFEYCTTAALFTDVAPIFTQDNTTLANEFSSLPSGTTPLPVSINAFNFPQ